MAGAAGVRAALRMALVDFYYHSIRFVPANAAWGVALAALLAAALFVSPLAALVGAPLLAVPLVGVARLATLVARGQDAVLSDAWDAGRRQGPVALAVGAASVVAVLVLGTNVALGFASDGPVGWSLATLAGWGLVVLWAAAFPFWVLLADPARETWSLGDRVRLTGLLLLAEPALLARLAVALALVVAVSTVLFAALLTIAVGYALLVTARAVLPAADRLSVRAPDRFPALHRSRSVAATPSGTSA